MKWADFKFPPLNLFNFNSVSDKNKHNEGSVFIHRVLGGEYKLLLIAKDHETHQSMVVYRGTDSFEKWIVPLSVFNRMFYPKKWGG